jgi:hypothetical protein
VAPLQTTYSPTYLVADRARSHAANRHTLAETSLPWRTRLPAPLTEAQEG